MFEGCFLQACVSKIYDKTFSHYSKMYLVHVQVPLWHEIGKLT